MGGRKIYRGEAYETLVRSEWMKKGSYEEFQSYSWNGWGVEYGVNPQIFDDLVNRLRKNKTTNLQNARVFFPKHVTFPRSKFRYFAKSFGGSITRKLELATVMVVDFFFLYKLVRKYDEVQRNAYLFQAEMDEGHYHWITEQTAAVCRSKNMEFERCGPLIQPFANDVTKASLDGWEHLVECIKQRPDVPIVSFDYLNNNVAGAEVVDMREYLQICQMVANASKREEMQMPLTLISSMNPKKYEIPIWVIMALIHSSRSHSRWSKGTNLYYNVVYRHMEKVAKIYFGKHWYSAACFYGHRFHTNSNVEESVYNMFKTILVSILNTGRKAIDGLPNYFVHWYLKHALKKYVDSGKFTNVFLYPGRMSIEDKIHNFLLDLIPGMNNVDVSVPLDERFDKLSRCLNLDIVYLSRYLIQNYDEQTESSSGPQLGTGLCEKAESNFSQHRDKPKRKSFQRRSEN